MHLNRKSDFRPAGTRDGDDLGPYPSDVDNNPTQQRILERALRAITIVATVEGLIIVALVMMIIAIFPLKEVYPYLVTFKGNEQQVVSIEPIAVDAPGIEYATEANVRDYVVQRHAFKPVETAMDAQWGPESRLAAMTEKAEFKEFETASELEKARMMQSGFSREIKIESAAMIRPDTWQVAFTTYDSLGGHNGTLTADPTQSVDPAQGPTAIMTADLTPRSTPKRWLATMTIDYHPQNITYEKRLLNPLGFTVTDYSVTGRN